MIFSAQIFDYPNDLLINVNRIFEKLFRPGKSNLYNKEDIITIPAGVIGAAGGCWATGLADGLG